MDSGFAGTLSPVPPPPPPLPEPPFDLKAQVRAARVFGNDHGVGSAAAAVQGPVPWRREMARDDPRWRKMTRDGPR